MNDAKADRRESPEGVSRLPVGLRGSYQLPEVTQTLREGLAEYYRVNPGLSEPRKIRDSRSAAYFHSHDTTHVVFGTHTGALHEAANDWWTFFGVDIRIRDYVGGFFATDESAAIMQQFGSPRQSAQLFLHGLRILPEVRRRAGQMHKKWPWRPPEEAWERPLCEIRAEYGIQVYWPEPRPELESHFAMPAA